MQWLGDLTEMWWRFPYQTSEMPCQSDSRLYKHFEERLTRNQIARILTLKHPSQQTFSKSKD